MEETAIGTAHYTILGHCVGSEDYSIFSGMKVMDAIVSPAHLGG